MSEELVNSQSRPGAEPPVASVTWPEPLIEDFTDPDWPSFDGDDQSIREWVLKNKKVVMRTITWNLCAKPPPDKSVITRTLLSPRFRF
jgi:hypothetical protein